MNRKLLFVALTSFAVNNVTASPPSERLFERPYIKIFAAGQIFAAGMALSCISPDAAMVLGIIHGLMDIRKENQEKREKIQSQLYTQSKRVHENGLLFVTVVPKEYGILDTYLECNQTLSVDCTREKSNEKTARVLIERRKVPNPNNVEAVRQMQADELQKFTDTFSSLIPKEETRFQEGKQEYISLRKFADQYQKLNSK